LQCTNLWWQISGHIPLFAFKHNIFDRYTELPPISMGRLKMTMNYTTLRTGRGVITADVVFGDPRMKCAGQGICRVSSPLANNNCSCIKVRAFLEWKQEGQFLSFVFPKVLIPHALYQIYFGQGIFVLPETVQVGKDVLGDTAAWLKKGKYEVQVASEFVEVQIACHPSSQPGKGMQEQKAERPIQNRLLL